ncbi:GGDEF domain-containing protein [Consotaella salsifontis]|uniref:diguanylate cyclase n=1 Tax=Consotaella salsifontis TaxID=1365950 RepID=A0A1T4RPU2_9HYPH|nr:GGDEF domain-containing protein [Consotaella salsifontis]SKA17897.1 diguanylate cyclase (GGDEF) domain-containing protein [Consotaella salsifontis]
MARNDAKGRSAWWELALTAGLVASIAVVAAFYTFSPMGVDATETGVTFALVLSLAGVFLHHIVLGLRLSSLNTVNSGLMRAATTDGLTGLFNRATFQRMVTREIRRTGWSSDNGAKHTLLILDLDHFKRINDQLGHAVGDEALVAIARTLKRSLRATDLVGRLGGEEFGIFLAGTGNEGAQLAAERLRRAVRNLRVGPAGKQKNLSVSIGGATFAAAAPFDLIYRAADLQLYRAKERGRDRVEITAGIVPANEGRRRTGSRPNGPMLTQIRSAPR